MKMDLTIKLNHFTMKCVREIPCTPLVICLAVLSAATFLSGQTSPPAPLQHSAVPASRLDRLRHGINASEWFAQVYDKRGYTREHFQSWTTAEDITLIKAMGFDHVRLSVNPAPMMPIHRPDEIPSEYLGYLDAAVKMILDQGLAVVIDLH